MTIEQLWQGSLSYRRTVPAAFLAFSAGLEVRHREKPPTPSTLIGHNHHDEGADGDENGQG
ncbi:hypothetical protein [Pseudomonas laurylsulfatiphila]